MKKRNLLTNIFYVVILVALAGYLVAEFALNDNESLQKILAVLSLAVAIISVGLVDIVFPILDNKDMLKNKKYVIITLVKTALFLAATIVLFLHTPFKVIKSTAVALVTFVVLYFLQYFISLDPKVEKSAADDQDLTEVISARDDSIEKIDNIDEDFTFDVDIEEK